MPRRLGQAGLISAVAAVALLGLLLAHHLCRSADHMPTSRAASRSVDALMPLSFVPNVGQADPRITFLATGRGGAVNLTAGGAVILPRRSASDDAGAAAPGLRMTLAGANRHPVVSGTDLLPGRVSYLVGPRASWHPDLPTFGQVVYRSVYPGIDVRYHGTGGRLEYDFALAAAADPKRIAIELPGARGLRIEPSGNLLVTFADRTVVERAPQIYEEIGGVRRPVTGGFRLLGRLRVGFTVGPRDTARPLVIDPTIVYSTQLRGSAPGEGLGIAVDRNRNTYLTGATASADFPTEHPLQARPKGPNVTAFVAKLDPAGALVYATYLGGSAYTEGRGIAVDAAGDAYLTGATNSTDFPTTKGALQSSYGGGPFDAFVTKLNAAGSRLVYSTFLGDTHYDEGNAIALDADRRAVITGKTVSPNFPLLHPLAPHTTSGAFVTKLSRAGSRLVASTVFGGDGPGNHADSGFGIAVDRNGDTYATGETNDPGFPTVAALQPTLAGGGNAFVIKINPASSRLIYSTYLGGSGNDIGRAIAADDDGNAYVTGQTTSPNFPTEDATQATRASGAADAFVAKLNSSGALVYATYLGGSGDDSASGIAVDRSQNVYVTGQTASPDFPLVSPLQRTLHGPSDAFLTELDRSGSFIAFSSYFGGRDNDAGQALALDGVGGIHFTGQTNSADFPRRGARAGPKRYAVPGDGAFVGVVQLAPRRRAP